MGQTPSNGNVENELPAMYFTMITISVSHETLYYTLIILVRDINMSLGDLSILRFVFTNCKYFYKNRHCVIIFAPDGTENDETTPCLLQG